MLMKRIHGSTESSTLISCETHSLSYRSGNRSKIPSFTLPSSWWGLHCLQCLGFPFFLTIRRGQNLRSSGYRLVNKLAFHNRVTSVESLLVKIYTHLACTFAYIMSIFRPYTLSWTFWRRAKRLPLQRLGRIQIEALSTTFLVSPKYWTSSRLWSMIYRRFWSLTVGRLDPMRHSTMHVPSPRIELVPLFLPCGDGMRLEFHWDGLSWVASYGHSYLVDEIDAFEPESTRLLPYPEFAHPKGDFWDNGTGIGICGNTVFHGGLFDFWG